MPSYQPFNPRSTVQEIHVARMPGYSTAANADNTTAFRAAVNEALTSDPSLPGGTNPGRTVVLPPGTTWIQPSAFTCSAYNGFSLRGADNYPSGGASYLKKVAGSGTSPLLSISNAAANWTHAGTISNVYFLDPTTQGGDGLYLNHTSYWRVINCAFRGFNKGLNLNDSFTNVVEGCRFESNAIGVYNGTAANHNTFRDSTVIANTTNGFYLAGGFGVYIDKCDIEQHTGGHAFVLNGAISVKMRDIYSEVNTGGLLYQMGASSAYRLKIDGLWTLLDGQMRFANGSVTVLDFCEYTTSPPSIVNDGSATITKINCTF